MKILIVEDETELNKDIKEYLFQNECVCESAADFKSAREKFFSYNYDVLVLDIMLPDGNGMQLLEELKKEKSEAGVLIISAKNSLDDKISGLNLGADDYLAKPFHLPELLARIKAIYRRKKFNGFESIKFNEIEIKTELKEVFASGKKIDLTVKEYELLLYFIANKNRVLTKDAIAEHLWGDYMDSSDNFDFIYQHVKNLRKKIMNSNKNDYIKTVYGLGYKFSDPDK